MKPTLLILAAGIGRRYGGLKQLEPVAPGGATIMDYSVYDALRGFRAGRVRDPSGDGGRVWGHAGATF